MPYFQRVSVFSSFPARVEIFIEMNTDTSIQLRVRVKLSAGEEASAELPQRTMLIHLDAPCHVFAPTRWCEILDYDE